MRIRPARPRLIAAALAILAAYAPPWAAAQTPSSGTFTARAACEAFQSFRRGTNPGGMRLTPGADYAIVAVNRPGGSHTHVQLSIPDAPAADERWVERDCGTMDQRMSRAATSNVLAANWVPAFCELVPGAAECRIINGRAGADVPASSRFSLHGLWPQQADGHCNVPADVVAHDRSPRTWDRLPQPQVDRETAVALAAAMPGTRSSLHRHEWIKHGTCYGAEGGADEYFDDGLWLLGQLNASPVRTLFADSIGSRLDTRDIRAAFDNHFGAGTGRRVRVSCEDGMIVELLIALEGEIVVGQSDLGALMRAARPVRQGCRGGRVDRAGRRR